jgi:hypothetical protein
MHLYIDLPPPDSHLLAWTHLNWSSDPTHADQILTSSGGMHKKIKYKKVIVTLSRVALWSNHCTRSRLLEDSRSALLYSTQDWADCCSVPRGKCWMCRDLAWFLPIHLPRSFGSSIPTCAIYISELPGLIFTRARNHLPANLCLSCSPISNAATAPCDGPSSVDLPQNTVAIGMQFMLRCAHNLSLAGSSPSSFPHTLQYISPFCVATFLSLWCCYTAHRHLLNDVSTYLASLRVTVLPWATMQSHPRSVPILPRDTCQ